MNKFGRSNDINFLLNYNKSFLIP